MKKNIFRITTVPISLKLLITGQMKYMQAYGFDVLAISADGNEVQDVKDYEGVEHMIVPMTRAITPLKDLKCLIQLYKIFKKEKPDIVHTHTPKAGLLGMLAARLANVPIRLHTIAGLPLMTTHGMKKTLLRNIERLTYWGAQEVWPNSQSLLDYIKHENLCPSKKLNMIGDGSSNGIDLNVFSRECLDENRLEELKHKINYQEQNIYLLAVGRVVKDKGIIELITAFIELKKQNDSLKLVLLGPLEEERKEELLPKEILNYILNNDSILHINWSDEVAYYMELADIFVHASYREGFPNVVLQAGAMKTPIICSKIPGNIDIVDHGIYGYIFEKANVDSLIKGISWVLNNKESATLQAENLRKRIEASYDRKKIHKFILDKYIEKLNG